jgi:ATP-dependent helicase HrpB
MPAGAMEDRADAIAQICHGAVSYKEIKEANVWRVLRDWLSPAQRAALDSYCPERIDLPNGQSAKITYEPGKDPFISCGSPICSACGKPRHRFNGRVPCWCTSSHPARNPGK